MKLEHSVNSDIDWDNKEGRDTEQRIQFRDQIIERKNFVAFDVEVLSIGYKLINRKPYTSKVLQEQKASWKKVA